MKFAMMYFRGHMKKIFCLLLAAASILSAVEKDFVREYTYDASEADSKLSCRTVALEQVKRLLLEEIGTYIDSYIQVENNMLTKDIIVSVTAGVTETKIVDEKWNGAQYYVKAQIKVDPDFVAQKLAEKAEDSTSVAEMVKLREENEKSRLEIEKLKAQLSKASTAQEKETITAQYQVQISRLDIKAEFERLTYLFESGKVREVMEYLDSKSCRLPAEERFVFKARIFIMKNDRERLAEAARQAEAAGVKNAEKIIQRLLFVHKKQNERKIPPGQLKQKNKDKKNKKK